MSFFERSAEKYREKPGNFKKPAAYSLRRRVLGYAVAASVFILAAFLLIGAYYSSLLVRNTYHIQQESLNNYNRQLTRDLAAAETCLKTFVNENFDIKMLITLNDPGRVPYYKIRTNNLFTTTLSYMTDIDGLFIYVPRTDSWVCHCNNIAHYPIDAWLKMQLCGDSGSALTEEHHSGRWSFVSVDGEYYLLCVIPHAFCYIGAWVHLDTLMDSPIGLSAYETSFYFLGTDGPPIGREGMADGFPSIEDYDSPHVIDSGHTQYLAVTSRLDFCDYRIVALISMEDIHSSLMSVYEGLLIAGVAMLLFLCVLLYYLDHFLQRPLAVLRQTADRLHQGDFDTRLDGAAEPCLELRQVDEAVNKLLDEIETLRIGIYEEQLARTEFELEYLKSQIAPHFLINCFQTLYALPGTPDGQALTQRMIQSLSGHLRYTLNASTYVPLSTELYYVQNYVELTNIRFPGCMTYEHRIDPICENAAVFPMILLMMTENTIKYNLVMGEPLLLQIFVSSCVQDGVRRIHLTHIDSGDGFDEESLDALNNLEADSLPMPAGFQVGLYNVFKRLKLLSQGQGSIRFSNEPRMGARIDIEIPYTEYEPDEGRKGAV